MKVVGIRTNKVYAQAPTKAQCFAQLKLNHPYQTKVRSNNRLNSTNNLYPEPLTIVREDHQRSELQRLNGLKVIVNPKSKVH